MNKHMERILKRVAELLSNSPYRSQDEPGGGTDKEPPVAGKGRRKKGKVASKAA